MSQKEQDPNLQAPQEANTTKHINFLEAEEDAASNSGNTNSEDDYESPTKKAWEDLRRDKEKESNGKD